jgi:VanZ family protein
MSLVIRCREVCWMNGARVLWALGWVLVGAAVIVCLLPARAEPEIFHEKDKIGHLAGHCMLTLYFAGLVARRSWWKIVVLLSLFGGAIEIAQYLMDVGRVADVRDVVANFAGALIGLLLARLGLERWPEFAARLLGQRRPAQ